MPLSARHGADVIVEEARRRPRKQPVVCVAPLTNLAVAVERAPYMPLLVGRLVIMGGSFRSPGNTAPTTEWNASVDPHAVKAVHPGRSEHPRPRRPARRGVSRRGPWRWGST